MAMITLDAPARPEPTSFAQMFSVLTMLRAAFRAAREYDALSALSDEALSRQGLTRDAVARGVFERHFA